MGDSSLKTSLLLPLFGEINGISPVARAEKVSAKNAVKPKSFNRNVTSISLLSFQLPFSNNCFDISRNVMNAHIKDADIMTPSKMSFKKIAGYCVSATPRMAMAMIMHKRPTNILMGAGRFLLFRRM